MLRIEGCQLEGVSCRTNKLAGPLEFLNIFVLAMPNPMARMGVNTVEEITPRPDRNY
jgi:hypothetical protein